MTTLLSRAFKTASGLPDSLQDELARELLEEMEWERKWDECLRESSSTVDSLAQQALEEFRAGKTAEAGFDAL